MMKVFRCQDMPEDVKDAFFNCNEFSHNDCYVDWYYKSCVPNEEYPLDNYVKVDNWLNENGLSEEEEHVLIEHCW